MSYQIEISQQAIADIEKLKKSGDAIAIVMVVSAFGHYDNK